ncbi:DNA-directed DNA polymerase [Dipsacomyces acuminosporus]|nr:DNA-directed DNA polymerase [Dipsacomyces acuminosporus]
MSTTTLDFYWGLASLDEEKRIDAATKLITALCEFQAKVQNNGAVAGTEEDLDRICASDVSYAVRRLIKGLASPRDGARQGYSMALAELLSRIQCISVKAVLDILWKHTQVSSSTKGQERRDMQFGRIFGLMALIQSGIIARTGTTAQDIKMIIAELTGIAAEKTYLRELSYVTMAHMVPMLGSFGFCNDAIATLVQTALNRGNIRTPDELYLALLLRREYPKYNWAAALPRWKGAHMLDAGNLSLAKKALCEMSEDSALFSNWHPQLHTVWDEIFDLYYNKERGGEIKKQKPVDFAALWDTVVEGGLFAPGASQFRRYWGFLLLERLLPNLEDTTVPLIMTPNIVRSLSENFSVKKSSPLAKVGIRTAEKLISIGEENSAIGVAILTHLLTQKNSAQQSDSSSFSLRTMIANRIVAKLDQKDITGYVDYLQQAFLTPNLVRNFSGFATPDSSIKLSVKSIDKQRVWVINQMVRIAKFGQLQTTDEVITKVLDFITAVATCNVVRPAGKDELPDVPAPPKPAVSSNVQRHCADALVSFIGDLNRVSKYHGKADGEANAAEQATGRLAAGCSRNGEVWAARALSRVLEYSEKKELLSVVLPDFEANEGMLRGAAATLGEMARKTKLHAKSDTDDALRFRAFELFLANIALMAAVLPQQAERAELYEAIPDLRECFDRMVAQPKAGAKGAKKRATRSSTKAEESDGEPKPVEVFTDILISLLTKNSNTLRRLCEQVFVPFSSIMTPTAIDSIAGVLQAKEGVAGDEDGQVETEMEIPDDLVDDEDAGVDGLDDDDKEQLEEVDEELRRKIEEALGDGAAFDDAAEVSASGEEEVYDDEQMKVFDQKLGEIFHHKKQQKLEVRDLKISFVNFKLRVLDLANVFLTKQPESPLVIRLLPAVLDLARSTVKDNRNKPIHDRTISILSSSRTSYPTGFKTADGLDLLRVVHNRASRAADKRESGMLANIASYLVQAVLDNKEEGPKGKSAKTAAATTNEISKLYRAALKDFMTRKTSQIRVDFFTSLARRLRPSRLPFVWELVVDGVSEYGHPLKAVNAYRQVQMFALAAEISATASRLSGQDDAAALVPMADKLLAAMQSAVTETLVYAASDKNANATTGKLILDSARLREALDKHIDVVRKLHKCPELTGTVDRFISQSSSDEWTSALQAIESSSRYTSPIIKIACQKLRDLAAAIDASKKSSGKNKGKRKADAE